MGGSKNQKADKIPEGQAKATLLSLRLAPPFTTVSLTRHMRHFEMNTRAIRQTFGRRRESNRIRTQLFLETLPEPILDAVKNTATKPDEYKNVRAAFNLIAETADHIVTPDEPIWGPQTYRTILESLQPGQVFTQALVADPSALERTTTPVAPDSEEDMSDDGGGVPIGTVGSDGEAESPPNPLATGLPFILKLYHVPGQKELLVCSYCQDIEDEHTIDDCPDKAAGMIPAERIALRIFNNPQGTIPAELDFGLFMKTARFGTNTITPATIFLTPYTTTPGQVHVVRDRSLLLKPKTINGVELKRIGSTETVQSFLKGSVLPRFGGYWSSNPDSGAGVAIHDVYFVPEAPCNSLSIHALGTKWKVFENQRLLQGPRCEALLARFPNGLLAVQAPVFLGPNDNVSPPPQWNTQSSFYIGYARTSDDMGKAKKEFSIRGAVKIVDSRSEEQVDTDLNHMDVDMNDTANSALTPRAAANSSEQPKSVNEDRPNITPALFVHTSTGPMFCLQRRSYDASFVLDPSATHHVVMSDKFVSSPPEGASEVIFSSTSIGIPPTSLDVSSAIVLSEPYDPRCEGDIASVEIRDVYLADEVMGSWLNILSTPLLVQQGWVVDRSGGQSQLRHSETGFTFAIKQSEGGVDFILASTWRL
ncbi:hypothetical protein Q8F55_006334 [Vanrija albida]|uniref:Uncharacterized protein n=1 Tax=Vanrija albida TaxID=181172 RepID=A0ABR3PX45_9TREE